MNMGYLRQCQSLVRVSIPLKRSMSSKADDLKGDIRKYLRMHEYKLMPLEARTHMSLLDVDRLEEMSLRETFSSENSKWSFKIFNDGSKACRIGSAGVFAKGYHALQNYVDDTPLPKSVEPAFRALERFYQNKDLNENSLRLLNKWNENKITDTKVLSLLAQHLLSKLLLHQSNYFLDKAFREDVCPCGCNEPIHFGLTQLGSPMLFNGQADIVLFPTDKDLFHGQDNSKSALFTLKMKENEDYGDRLIDDDRNSDDDWNSVDDIDEDLSTGEYEAKSLEESSACQLYKQAISMSMCKKKRMLRRNGNINGNDLMMIPVCGVTNNSYSIIMYDAENDFLLKMQNRKSESLELFEGRYLNPLAILDLWLVINHHLFLTKLPQKVLSRLKGSCNLINVIGEKKFEKIVINSDWLYQVESLGDYQRTDIPLKDQEVEDIDEGIKKYPLEPLSDKEEN